MPAELAYAIRRLLPYEAEAYRAIRLEALQTEPGIFGNSYAKESDFPDEQWQARVSNPHGAVFGLYHGEELVGLTGIVVDAEVDPVTGYMTQSYIRPEHRGRRLSRMLYDARIAWARERGLKRLTIGHRESNAVSKAANQRYGFRYMHREEQLWSDGGREAMVYYELEL